MHRKIRRVLGVVLLVFLIVPVVVLCIPATGTQLVILRSPGFPNLISTEYVEYTYIPLVELVRNQEVFYPSDIAFLVVYFSLYGLAIWLIRHRARNKELAKEESL